MNYLVLCPCSHGLDRHTESGCSGDGFRACNCPLTATAALEEAVDDARRNPWLRSNSETDRPAESA